MRPRPQRLLSAVLAGWFLSVSSLLFWPTAAIAAPSLHLDASLPKQALETLAANPIAREVFEAIDQQHQALSDPHLPPGLARVLSNKQLLKDADRFLNESPAHLCRAYRDSLKDEHNPTWAVLEAGARSAMTLTSSISTASAAGAGSLTGYAGLASTISTMGLGGTTTLIAGWLGSNATGAAATAVVTSAVGGPAVMGALLVGGAGILALGTYEAGHLTFKQLGEWAELYCNAHSQNLS